MIKATRFDHIGAMSACLFKPIMCVESSVHFQGIGISTF